MIIDPIPLLVQKIVFTSCVHVFGVIPRELQQSTVKIIATDVKKPSHKSKQVIHVFLLFNTDAQLMHRKNWKTSIEL